MTGPLVRYRDGFAAELTSHGYTDLSLANLLRLMADLSDWLERKDIEPAGIDHEVISRFLAKRRRTHTVFRSQHGLEPLLRHLAAAGAVVIAPAVQPRRRGVLAAYERYLTDERDVGPRRRAMCLAVAEDFLGGKSAATLQAADVTAFIAERAHCPSLSGLLSGLRSVLRFLFVSSQCKTNLVYAVPSSPRWTQQSLPQGLDPGELDAVIGTCDRRTLVGARDYAVLLLLSRLGLRAGEVAALRLDDIDWRAGELSIHGKGRRLSRLPLPDDVGQAIASYLRRACRSKTTRSVFVGCRAPYASLGSGSIVAIARRALRAAGIPRGGAHRLRYTAATQMLRRGASMTEIAQVLRHRHVNTTAIYAKVDSEALRTVARRWPKEGDAFSMVRTLARRWPGGVA
jgi:integrase